MSITFVLASHVIGPDSYNVVEDASKFYNVSVLNNNSLADANIVEVNVTLPTSFSYAAGQGSSANSILIVSGNVLSWRNESGLVLNLTTEYFWFNATASTPGSYNLTVSSKNSTDVILNNISVVVNDTTAPNLTFESPTAAAGANLSQTYLYYNVSSSDVVGIDTIILRVYNTTDEIYSVNSTTSPLYGNVSNLSEGTYYMNASVNDSALNVNNSETRIFVLDTTDPISVTLESPSDGTSSTTNDYNFTFKVNDSNGIDYCNLMFDGSSTASITSGVNSSGIGLNGIYKSNIAAGTYSWRVDCYDYAGNSKSSSSRDITVESSGSSGSSGTTGGTTTSYWSNTFVVSELNLAAGYSRLLGEKDRLKMSIDNENHYVGVTDITGEEVTINVSSDPQTFILDEGEDIKVEVTDDNFYDLYIIVNEVNDDSANLTVEGISIELTPEEIEALGSGNLGNETTGITSGQNLEEDGLGFGGILLTVFIIIVIISAIVGVALYYKYKKNKSLF